jgi:RNA polymerase sigma-70 factor, ECF subfamily
LEPIEDICEVVSVNRKNLPKPEGNIGNVTTDEPEVFPETENRNFEDIDADLVARCRAELPDKTTAYYELLQKYEPMVYGTCYRMLGDPREAEEATQDTFLRIYHKIHQFEGRSTFKTWMFRIICNFCMTRRRKLAMKRERDKSVGQEIISQTNETYRKAIDPGEDDREYVHLALQELREEDREIISLRFISDLGLEEIAGAIGLKLSATKMRLYRAMEKFKEVYLKLQKNREEALGEY